MENLRDFFSPCGPWPIVDNNSFKKQNWSKPAKPKDKNTKGRPKPAFRVASHRIFREMRTQIGTNSPQRGNKKGKAREEASRRNQGQAQKNHRTPRKKQRKREAKEKAKGQHPEKMRKTSFFGKLLLSKNRQPWILTLSQLGELPIYISRIYRRLRPQFLKKDRKRQFQPSAN